ncbi:hypothetical protein KIPB_010988, partial [Kipferlia bialata]
HLASVSASASELVGVLRGDPSASGSLRTKASALARALERSVQESSQTQGPGDKHTLYREASNQGINSRAAISDVLGVQSGLTNRIQRLIDSIPEPSVSMDATVSPSNLRRQGGEGERETSRSRLDIESLF